MRTFFQLILISGLLACSASPRSTAVNSKLSAKPESGVYNVKHQGSEYQISLETAESQAFESLSAQPTSFIVDMASKGDVDDRLTLFANVYVKSRPEFVDNGNRILLNGKNYRYQIDQSILANGRASYQVSCLPNSNAMNDTESPAKAILNSKNLASFLQSGSLELTYLYK